MNVRDAAEADIAAITAIYRHHVRHGVASFELEPPDEAEMTRRWRGTLDAGSPFLVADQDGAVIGYAYVGPYRPRPAYRHTVENSVYVAHDCQKRGAGRALLGALIARCRSAGRKEMVAIIGDSGNTPSIALHRAFGFRHVGTLNNVGFKHERWLDSVIMQLSL